MNILKTVRATEKSSGMTFIEVDIYHQMRQLRMLYSWTLTFIFKFKHFFYAFIKEIAQATDVPGRFVSIRTTPLLNRSCQSTSTPVFKFQSYIVDWYIALNLYHVSLIHLTPSGSNSDFVDEKRYQNGFEA